MKLTTIIINMTCVRWNKGQVLISSDANVNEILMTYWNTSKSYVIKNQYVLHKKKYVNVIHFLRNVKRLTLRQQYITFLFNFFYIYIIHQGLFFKELKSLESYQIICSV
jgi:hypothetical protein